MFDDTIWIVLITLLSGLIVVAAVLLVSWLAVQYPGLHYYNGWYCMEGVQSPPRAVELMMIMMMIVYGIFCFPVALVCQVS